MSESEAPTPVEPLVQGLKGQVAHGPAKDWDKVGKTVAVQITAPVETVKWLRSNGYVLSRVFQESAARLMGSGELDRLDRQIEFHREQVTILEAAKVVLGDKKTEADAAESSTKQRLSEIQRLIDAYRLGGRTDREQFSFASSLRWIEARIAKSPTLRHEDPAQLLKTVSSAAQGDS